MKYIRQTYFRFYNEEMLIRISYYLSISVLLLICSVFFTFSSLKAEERATLYSTDPTSTAWVKSKNAKSRLLSGYLEAKSDNILGGLEITLRKKWKTYWRIPGEAGLPPKFDFSASENLQKAEILWPAPNRYVDRFGVAIGYKDRVIFPIRITPKDKNQPVILKLRVDYAACEIVCIPLSAHHALTFKQGEQLEGKHLKSINSFVNMVPRPIEDVKYLEILGIKTAGKGEKAHLVLDMKSRIGFRQPEIFIEGPEDLYFRTPKLTNKPSVVSRWHVPISGNIDENPLLGKKVRVTFIDGERRAETEYEIKK